MSSQSVTTLWSSESLVYNTGNGRHQWFSKDGAVIDAGATILPDATGEGIWTAIDMKNYNYLRIYGTIVTVDAALITASNAGIMTYAFNRGPESTTAILRGTDEILGQNISRDDADQLAGNTRLTNFAVQGTVESSAVARASNFFNPSPIILGATAVDSQPIARSTGIATGQISTWWYDVGLFATVGLTGPQYQEQLNPGKPLARCSGFNKVYVALKAINTSAWTGSGTFLIGGEIKAVAYNEGSSLP